MQRNLILWLIVLDWLGGALGESAWALSWTTQTVDSTGDVGKFTSLALDSSGNPHISYYGNGTLKYTKWTGSTWSIQTVDTGAYRGQYSSLVLDSSGNPRIGYCDSSGNVMYASWNGSTWDIQAVTGTAGSSGGPSALALDSSGKPRIVSIHSTVNMKYSAWNGSTWDSQTVENVGVSQASLALDGSGNPRISYYVSEPPESRGLRYAARNGSTWDIQTVEAGYMSGVYNSLALDSSGDPHIAYYIQDYPSGPGRLRYAAWNGSTWDIQTVDSMGSSETGENMLRVSLTLDNSGNPYISYYVDTNTSLKYAYKDGSGWHTETVDNAADVGKYTSLKRDSSGNIYISYYDATNGNLKYAYGTPEASTWLLFGVGLAALAGWRRRTRRT